MDSHKDSPADSGSMTAQEEEKTLQVLWPLSIGAEMSLAHTFTVTTTAGGHILELGRFMLSGHVRRTQAEIREFLTHEKVHVVGRFFLPAGSLENLQQIIETRLAHDRSRESDSPRVELKIGTGPTEAESDIDSSHEPD